MRDANLRVLDPPEIPRSLQMKAAVRTAGIVAALVVILSAFVILLAGL